MTILGFLVTPRCPRCGGVLLKDAGEDDPYCLACGYRMFEPVEDDGGRRRLPVLPGAKGESRC